MSDNEEQNPTTQCMENIENQQGNQDAGSLADGTNTENSNIVPPLDLNLDLDLVSSPGTPQHVSGLVWLSDTLANDVVEANSILVPKGRRDMPGNRDYN